MQVLNIFHKVEDFLLGVITNIKIQIVTKKSGTIMDKNNLYIFLHNYLKIVGKRIYPNEMIYTL